MRISVTQAIAKRYFPYLDLASIFLAFGISFMMLPYLKPFLSHYPGGGVPSMRDFSWILLVLTPLWFVLMRVEDAYKQFTQWSYLTILGKMGKITILVFACSSLIIFIMKETGMSRLFMSSMCLVLLLLSTFSRLLFRWKTNIAKRRGNLKHNVLLVGDGVSVARFIRDILTGEKKDVLEIAGYVETGKEKSETELRQFGFLEDLKDVLNEMPVDQAILILTAHNIDKFQKIFEICEQTGTTLRIINEYLFHKHSKSKYSWKNDFFADLPSIYAAEVNWSTEKEITKRAFDLFFAGMTILVLSPILVLIALMIKFTSPGPVFYKRQLIGRHGKPFVALKFRSMKENAHELLETDTKLKAEYQESLKIKNDPRVTKVGNFLRKTSLDELPQFINVFMGEMSVVGPRMLGDIEWEKYGEAKAKVLSVKPGITGLWQVDRHHKISFEERIQCDLSYINSHNFTMDLGIILKTILVVFRMQGEH